MRIILIMLLLTACDAQKTMESLASTSPIYTVGDCVKELPDENREDWELPKKETFRIKQIGKSNYLVELRYGEGRFVNNLTLSFSFIDKNTKRIDCEQHK